MLNLFSFIDFLPRELQGLVSEGRGVIAHQVQRNQQLLSANAATLTRNLEDLEAQAKVRHCSFTFCFFCFFCWYVFCYIVCWANVNVFLAFLQHFRPFLSLSYFTTLLLYYFTTPYALYTTEPYTLYQ